MRWVEARCALKVMRQQSAVRSMRHACRPDGTGRPDAGTDEWPRKHKLMLAHCRSHDDTHQCCSHYPMCASITRMLYRLRCRHATKPRSNSRSLCGSRRCGRTRANPSTPGDASRPFAWHCPGQRREAKGAHASHGGFGLWSQVTTAAVCSAATPEGALPYPFRKQLPSPT